MMQAKTETLTIRAECVKGSKIAAMCNREGITLWNVFRIDGETDTQYASRLSEQVNRYRNTPHMRIHSIVFPK